MLRNLGAAHQGFGLVFELGLQLGQVAMRGGYDAVGNVGRQTFFKPYCVIYRVSGSQVIVYLVADGRRDIQTVLARRLLDA